METSIQNAPERRAELAENILVAANDREMRILSLTNNAVPNYHFIDYLHMKGLAA